MMWFAIVLVCFWSVLSDASAQDKTGLGIFGASSLNMHRADFRAFPGVPNCCPAFTSGSGSAIVLGAIYQMPLTPQTQLSLRAGYSGLSGTLERSESTILSGGVQGTFQHTVQARLADIGFEPQIHITIWNQLWLAAGVRLAYLSQTTFSQKEQVQTPGFLFSNLRTTRNEISDAPLSNASSFLAGIVSGVGYQLPLNTLSSLVLSPEISYVLPLTQLVQGVDWNVHQIRFGASLMWYPVSTPALRPRQEHRIIIDTVQVQGDTTIALIRTGKEQLSSDIFRTDTEEITMITRRRTDTLRTALSPPPPTKLQATVTATALYENGREEQAVRLVQEEFSSMLMTPLLNYIFFEENSAAIPPNYHRIDQQTRDSFREETVNDVDRLKTYYHILNIIGQRLRARPTSTITLIGCNADIGAEKGNTPLSEQRAQAVKNYLVQSWDIPERSIRIEARNLPAKAANTVTTDGAQENRRVEILSSNFEIIAPIITHDTLRTMTPPALRFRTHVEHSNDIAHWTLTAQQDKTILKKFDGTGSVPDVLDWNVNVETNSQPLSTSSIEYALTVHDKQQQSKSSTPQILPVELLTIKKKNIERRADKEIQRFSLILFDVRSDEITPANKAIIARIKPYITSTSTVTIVGYTDRLGDAQQNQQLAQGRATKTAREIGIPAERCTLRAEGNATLFSANAPEGRLYTRMVEIIIETPLVKN